METKDIQTIKKLTDLELGERILLHLDERNREDVLHTLYDLSGIGNDYYELAQSLDLIAKVEAVAVKRDSFCYERSLLALIGYDIQKPITPRLLAITATARQRAEACLAVLWKRETK